jgi:hypothetical protein
MIGTGNSHGKVRITQHWSITLPINVFFFFFLDEFLQLGKKISQNEKNIYLNVFLLPFRHISKQKTIKLAIFRPRSPLVATALL